MQLLFMFLCTWHFHDRLANSLIHYTLCTLIKFIMCTIKSPEQNSLLVETSFQTDDLGRGDTVIWYMSPRHAVRRRQPGSDIWFKSRCTNSQDLGNIPEHWKHWRHCYATRLPPNLASRRRLRRLHGYTTTTNGRRHDIAWVVSADRLTCAVYGTYLAMRCDGAMWRWRCPMSSLRHLNVFNASNTLIITA